MNIEHPAFNEAFLHLKLTLKAQVDEKDMSGNVYRHPAKNCMLGIGRSMSESSLT